MGKNVGKLALRDAVRRGFLKGRFSSGYLNVRNWRFLKLDDFGQCWFKHVKNGDFVVMPFEKGGVIDMKESFGMFGKFKGSDKQYFIKIAMGLIGAGCFIFLFKTFFALNATWSLPEWGWFRVPVVFVGDDFKIGDRVEFENPIETPWTSVKIIKGLEGQVVTVDGQRVFLDGEYVATAKTHARDGRELEVTKGGVVPAGKAFVLGSHRDSWDSRYEEIGFIPLDGVLSKLYVLPDVHWLGLDGPLLREGDLE